MNKKFGNHRSTRLTKVDAFTGGDKKNGLKRQSAVRCVGLLRDTAVDDSKGTLHHHTIQYSCVWCVLCCALQRSSILHRQVQTLARHQRRCHRRRQQLTSTSSFQTATSHARHFLLLSRRLSARQDKDAVVPAPRRPCSWRRRTGTTFHVSLIRCVVDLAVLHQSHRSSVFSCSILYLGYSACPTH